MGTSMSPTEPGSRGWNVFVISADDSLVAVLGPYSREEAERVAKAKESERRTAHIVQAAGRVKGSPAAAPAAAPAPDPGLGYQEMQLLDDRFFEGECQDAHEFVILSARGAWDAEQHQCAKELSL